MHVRLPSASALRRKARHVLQLVVCPLLLAPHTAVPSPPTCAMPAILLSLKLLVRSVACHYHAATVRAVQDLSERLTALKAGSGRVLSSQASNLELQQLRDAVTCKA